MTTKTSSIGQWVGAVIAAVVIIGASFLGFHAFNARAHANAELKWLFAFEGVGVVGGVGRVVAG